MRAPLKPLKPPKPPKPGPGCVLPLREAAGRGAGFRRYQGPHRETPPPEFRFNIYIYIYIHTYNSNDDSNNTIVVTSVMIVIVMHGVLNLIRPMKHWVDPCAAQVPAFGVS